MKTWIAGKVSSLVYVEVLVFKFNMKNQEKCPNK